MYIIKSLGFCVHILSRHSRHIESLTGRLCILYGVRTHSICLFRAMTEGVGVISAKAEFLVLGRRVRIAGRELAEGGSTLQLFS